MRYAWFRNVTPEALWFGYRPGDTLDFAYEGELIGDGGDIKTARRQLFEIFNVAHPDDYRGRSMSVGDVVVLGDEFIYACDRTGWADVTQEMTRSVLAAQAVRKLDAAVIDARTDPGDETKQAAVREAMTAYFEAALRRQADEYIARTQ